ncbi:MAG: DMT family transporter [Candidatus Thorarchaeota archaeon]
MSKKTLAWFALLITTVVWASSLIFGKIVYADGMTPIMFVALRYTIAAPFLIILVRFTRSSSASTEILKSKWKIIFVVGLAGPFLSQILQYIGLSMTTAGETLLLLNLTPVFAVIIAVPLLKERVTSEKLGGLILATLGATIIVIGGNSLDYGFDSVRLIGDGMIIFSTLLFAINGIAGKIAVDSVDAISVTLYSTLFAIPFIWLSAGIVGDLHVLLELSIETWAIMLWVGLVNTALGFTLYYEAMKHIEASIVQIGLSLIAVWGVLMSVFVLGEATSIFQIIGGALTIIGVILVQRVYSTPNQITHPKSPSFDSNKL